MQVQIREVILLPFRYSTTAPKSSILITLTSYATFICGLKVIDLILANTASIPAGSVPKISITPSQ
jgi:hypothetical protein